MKYFLTLSFTVLLVTSGCEKKVTKQPPTTPPPPRVVTVPDIAKGAVDKVGGEQAWSDTQVIIGECTAKFYKPDGTFYLTRQRHAVYPWSDSIRVYAAEPQGTFVWQLSGSNFTLLEGTPEQAVKLPVTLCDSSIARMIWSVMAAPASVATQAPPNATFGAALRIEGLWHYPLWVGGGQTWFMNQDSGVLDIYKLEILRKGIYLMARGYDYRTVEKTGVKVPTKIEISHP
jgi:hypothetical protein